MEKRKKLVIFTGAGVSADSGLSTFRDADGLWEKYRIEEVCTPEAWQRNPALVIEFYNQRRKQLLQVEPNPAHRAIAGLEQHFEVEVITQNVDDLHERAGSSRITHLHGELTKVRSSLYPDLIYTLDGWEQNMSDRCERGHPLRPHIVFFDESVPMMDTAIEKVHDADILVVVGTSLNIYPAAGLLSYAPSRAPIYVVDPGEPELGPYRSRARHIRLRAAEGMPQLAHELCRYMSGE